ncbi:MAG: class I SAM-dependent methyltransferase [Ilumatobacteraceae bacterium]
MNGSREDRGTDSDADGKAWLASVFDRAAPTYDGPAGAYHDHFGERLVELAGVGPGDAVLDVACGRGAALVPAAARVGASGRVVGVDLSPEMVRLARERSVAAGITAELAVMDAERLDVPDASFTVVLCGFGVFFLPDPDRAVAGFRRALAAGGSIGVSTWGAEDERWAWEDDLLADVSVERRAVRRPFDDPADLEALLCGAGFTGVEVRTVDHEVELADADEWWRWKWSYSLRGLLEQLPQERLDRLRREASERIGVMRASHGGLPLRLSALIATGRVQSSAPAS